MNLDPGEIKPPARRASSHISLKTALITAATFLGLVGLYIDLPRQVFYTVACGHRPIVGTNFAASYTYYRPGDRGYSPSFFHSYYCSEEAAQAKGLHRLPTPEEEAKTAAHYEAQYKAEDAARRVNYPIYRPAKGPAGFKAYNQATANTQGGYDPRSTGQNLYFWITLKNPNGQAREVGLYEDKKIIVDGKTQNYQCTNPSASVSSTCKVIGTGTDGQPVYQIRAGAYSSEMPNTLVYLDLNAQPGTPVPFDLPPADILKIFNSLQVTSTY
jgi:hypothetical protein